LKNLLYPLFILLYAGCNLVSDSKYAKEDSLEYYPPTPTNIPQKEFRYYYNRVQQHFDSLLLKSGFSGQVVVAKNGVIVFEKSMGFADFRTKDSLTASTPLHIASVSKTFTAMAILHMAETGKLHLTDSLENIFPGFPYAGITIKMLLSHRSGLPNYVNYLSSIKKTDTCYRNTDVLNSLFALQPNPEFKPGTRFSYSNTNYVLLALLVEKLTGEKFADYMQRMFFTPLQMTSSFVYTPTDSARATPSFEWNGNYWRPDQFDCTCGDKNIYSTAKDLLKWDQALYSGQLFRQATLDSAFAALSNETKSIHNYGFGWRSMNFPSGKRIIYHNGRWHGSNASFARLPDEKATIIILGNKFNRNIYWSGYLAYNIFGEYFPRSVQPKEEDMNTGDRAAAKTKKFTKSRPPAEPEKTKR
jgi:CubicO group peptidase (beta-lactamase class C family)